MRFDLKPHLEYNRDNPEDIDLSFVHDNRVVSTVTLSKVELALLSATILGFDKPDLDLDN